MADIFNTLIIGAGPAGLSAARHLKENTLVLDRKKEIGSPVRCGEGISIDLLERENLSADPAWIKTYIKQIKRIAPNGKHISEKRSESIAYVLDRGKFEKHLADLVPWEIRLNARVNTITREDGQWKVETADGITVFGKYLIGADGPASMVVRSVFNIRHELIPALNYLVTVEKPLPQDELLMYFGRKIAPKGYGWVFPTSQNTANIGLLMKEKGSVRDGFRRFLDDVVHPRFGSAILEENKSGVLPVNGFMECVVKDNAFAVGDAGAFTDPIFEGGINMALLTGRLAADAINLHDPDHYQGSINALPFTGNDLKKAQEAFYSLDDDTFNDLTDILEGKSTSFLGTEEGQKMFLSKDRLVQNKEEIFYFFKTWQKAKAYLF